MRASRLVAVGAGLPSRNHARPASGTRGQNLVHPPRITTTIDAPVSCVAAQRAQEVVVRLDLDGVPDGDDRVGHSAYAALTETRAGGRGAGD